MIPTRRVALLGAVDVTDDTAYAQELHRLAQAIADARQVGDYQAEAQARAAFQELANRRAQVVAGQGIRDATRTTPADVLQTVRTGLVGGSLGMALGALALLFLVPRLVK